MSRLAVALALALASTGLAQHTAKVHALAYSPGGKLLVSGGEDGRLVTWDAATGTKLAESRVGRTPWAIRDLAFAPAGDWFVAGGGGRVRGGAARSSAGDGGGRRARAARNAPAQTHAAPAAPPRPPRRGRAAREGRGARATRQTARSLDGNKRKATRRRATGAA